MDIFNLKMNNINEKDEKKKVKNMIDMIYMMI